MLDAQSSATLADIIRRESRSLLSYMADAYPWASAKKEPALETLRQTVHASSTAVTTLGKYLVKQRATPPVLGSYPTYFTSCNFVGLEWLLPRLVASEKESLATLEADAHKVHNEGAKEQLAVLAAVKRKNLAALESL